MNKVLAYVDYLVAEYRKWRVRLALKRIEKNLSTALASNDTELRLKAYQAIDATRWAFESKAALARRAAQNTPWVASRRK